MLRCLMSKCLCEVMNGILYTCDGVGNIYWVMYLVYRTIQIYHFTITNFDRIAYKWEVS